MRKSSLSFCFALLCTISASTSFGDEIDFERDILPIFKQSCLDCHGPDEQESAFRVDSRVALLKGGDYGEPALVPGDIAQSLLIKVVSYDDPDLEMPPDEKLSDEKIELLKRWVKEGGIWPGQMDAKIEKVKSDHWSFQPVVRPEVPSLNSELPLRNEVDSFIQAKLKSKNISGSPEADARTLIRRVSVILTGLPPTPERLASFESAYSKDPDATYRQLVDELLESPHFGERWAQHWLDVIRWAETNGSEANLYRKNAWIYRDYVVRAFNQDKPYDRFVQEQIAGDTMGSGEATGFLVAGPHVPPATVGREPTAIRQARADRMDEIMQTVGASMMGVTVGCARCHNHKFDPISIKDYYSMTGVFQDVEFGARRPEFAKEHPVRQRSEELWKQIVAQRTELRKFGGWEENWGAFRELHFKPISTKAVRIKFMSPRVTLDELEIFGPEDRRKNLVHKRHGTKISGFPEKGIENRNPISLIQDGEFGTMTWRAKIEKDSKEKAWIVCEFEEPQEIDRLRMSANREYFYGTDYLTKKTNLPRYEFDIEIQNPDSTWKPWVGTSYVNKQLSKKNPERKSVLARNQELIDSLGQEGPRPSFIGRFTQPQPTFILSRGSPEQPREEVVPAGPEVIDGDLKLTSDAKGHQRRAEFAKWISNTQNPLTSRVMVNRIWHHVFGTGIVSTTSDFGKAGAPPSHPELLDWLAAEFIEPTSQYADADSASAAWSMKSMIRMLVLSHAFRQSSLPNDAGLEADASAALLWRFPPKRVEAEVIRDSILQASGALDRSVGGKSYRIHNEKKTYAQWQVIDNHSQATWRRLLYQERMRRVDDKNFTAFDFPDCGQIRARRPVSTTPLQALNLMNSEFVVEQSKRVADRAMQESDNDQTKSLERCFRLVLNRKPTEEESKLCLEIADEQGLEIVCRALINSNEFAFLP